MRSMVNYLKQLGLTEYQSRVMIVLFCKQEATAKNICTLGNIGQTKIYQVLKSLGDKGLVTFNYSKPREYFGIAPVKAMDRLIGKKEKIIKKLKKQKDTTVKQLEKIDFDLGGYQKSEHPMWSVEPYKF